MAAGEVEALFGAWDYVVLVLVLLVSSGIGIYYRMTGGKQKTVQEYLLADRNMSFTPVAFSLMASFMSAITLIGVSKENYTFGIQFIIINFSYGLATPIAAYLYLPVFFKLQATSAYEYLEKRFGRASRLSASIAYSLQMVLYMGIVLYAPALALEAATGISQTAAILVIGLVCTFYSTIGGMKAVLMTDVFQSLLMFAAIYSIIICGAVQNDGLSGIWRIAEQGGRTDILNFSPDPTVRHTWWTMIIGGAVTYLSLYAVNQTQVQRYLTTKDLKTAQKAIWLNWPILTALSLSTSFAGLTIYAKYHDCDPVKSKRISSSDQLMPLYVLETMGNVPGVCGLFVAGIFSASLSTVSASVNSMAAVTLEDYIKPLYKKFFRRSIEYRTAVQSKVISCVFGLLCVGIAFIADHLGGGVLQASLTIFGVVGGPLFGLFSLGMLTTKANEKGSLIGLYTGLAFSMWIGFGGPKPPLPALPVSTEGCSNENTPFNATTLSKPVDDSDYFWLYRISYMWYSVLGFVVTFFIGYSFSLLFDLIDKSPKKPLDPDLFVPPLARRLRKIYGPKGSPNLPPHSLNKVPNNNREETF